MDSLLSHHFASTVEQAECDGVRITIRTNGRSKYMLYCEAKKMDTPQIKWYCEQHDRAMNDVMVEKGKRNIVFVYDLRDTQYHNFHETIGPFVQLHQKSREVYQKRLIGTVIVINNEIVANLVNFLLTTIYTPTRPLRLANGEAQVAQMLIEVGGIKPLKDHSSVQTEGGYVSQMTTNEALPLHITQALPRT